MKEIEVINTKTPISIKQIKETEKQLTIIFPEDFKNYLLKHNGGHPIKDNFPLMEFIDNNGVINETSFISWFFAIYDGYYYNLIKEYLADKGTMISEEMITIGCNSFGDNICLCVFGDNYGKVFLWHHKKENPEEDNPRYENLYLIAHSFTDFINSLYGFEVVGDHNNVEKWINTHDKYSLPFSPHVRKYGNVITDFFKKAPQEIKEFIIEDIEKAPEIVLWYKVDSEDKKYIRKIGTMGKILEEKMENV